MGASLPVYTAVCGPGDYIRSCDVCYGRANPAEAHSLIRWRVVCGVAAAVRSWFRILRGRVCTGLRVCLDVTPVSRPER